MRENLHARLKLPIGDKFGRWTVIGFSHISKNRQTMWKCACDCGIVKSVLGGALTSGASKSCGCFKNERASETHGLAEGVASRNATFQRYKNQANARGLKFNLSLSEFDGLTKGNCFYCGNPPSQKAVAKGCNGHFIYNGIDRLDNNKGYYLKNCAPCCRRCNRAKDVMSLEEFHLWITKVYNKFILRRLQHELL